MGARPSCRAQVAEERERYVAAAEVGDVSSAVVWASEAVDLIRDLPPAAEIVQRMVSEAGAALGARACPARRRRIDERDKTPGRPHQSPGPASASRRFGRRACVSACSAARSTRRTQGHLAISLEALKRLRLDRVWWLVSPQNPLKPSDETTDLEAAPRRGARRWPDHPRVVVSDLERGIGTRYTVDTLGVADQETSWPFRLADRRRQPGSSCRSGGAGGVWYAWSPLPFSTANRILIVALAGRMARAYAGERLVERRAPVLAECPPPAWVYLRLRRHQVSSTAIRQERAASRRRSR